MFNGFIKTAAITPQIKLADTAANAAEIVSLVGRATEKGVKLAVFPELSVTGATCGDLFLNTALIDGAASAIACIAADTAELDCAIVVGAPIRRENKLYNCAVVICHGEILGIVPKKRFSQRSEICEARIFTPAPEKCGTCELFGIPYPFGSDMLFYLDELHDFNFACVFENELYLPEPVIYSHARAGATVICCLGASREYVGREELRRDFIRTESGRLCCGFAYAGAGDGESVTDGVCGGQRIIAERGEILSEAAPFAQSENPIVLSEIDVSKLASLRLKDDMFIPIEVNAYNYYSISVSLSLEQTDLTRSIRRFPFVPEDIASRDARCARILDIQANALAARLRHINARRAVIGVSGGLDSCLALIVAVKAMDILNRPHTDVLSVTMPCFGTTDRTRNNAKIISERLSCEFRTVDIRASVRQHFSDIGHSEDVRNVVYENGQARERTQVIMDIANAEGGIVVGTGDLSELALGWATYNGDHMSMYAVNASVPKTLMPHIISYYGKLTDDATIAEVLGDIIDTPVSPELLPADNKGDIAQRTEDLVGPYALHDFFLYWFLGYGLSPAKIEYMANYAFSEEYAPDVISKWLSVFTRRFISQQFKRSCLPDGPSVGNICVSPRGALALPSDAFSTLFSI